MNKSADNTNNDSYLRRARDPQITVVTVFDDSSKAIPNSPRLQNRRSASMQSTATPVSARLEMEGVNKTTLRRIIEMNLSPVGQSPPPGVYRCFICWETSTDKSQFMIPCNCKSNCLRFAHKACINRWVDDTKTERCPVCGIKYGLNMTAIPFREIVKKNFFVLASFFLQLALPVVIYFALYLNGSLARINPMFLAGHIVMLAVMYVLYAIQVFGGLNRHSRRVVPMSEID